MNIIAFDFGILMTHKNSKSYHFFNVGDKNSLERFFKTNCKSNFIKTVYYLDLSNIDIELPGYSEMMSFLYSECSEAVFKKFTLYQLEDMIDSLPLEVYERKVCSAVR